MTMFCEEHIRSLSVSLAARAIMAVVVIGLAGCTNEPTADMICVPGDTQPCDCDAGLSSAKICAPNGLSWGPCGCLEDDAGADSDADSDADSPVPCTAGALAGNLWIEDQQSMTRFAGVTEVAGTLNISGPDIVELRHLDCLEFVEGLDIAGTALTDLTGLSSLASTNSLGIRNNANLVSLDGLGALTYPGSLSIEDNPALETLIGLGSIRELEYFVLYHNDLLTDLRGLDALDWRTTPGLSISDNDGLTSLEGLHNLVEIKVLSHIRQNDALTSLEGLRSLQRAEHFGIVANNALPTLGGLSSLDSAQMLVVSQNESLAALELDALTTVGSLSISSNPSLPTCDAEALLTQLTSCGESTIEGNNDEATCE